ncbi:MAG: O-antigen ligase family protein [Phycisphaerales bacterium]|jgi:hypothetical protein
MSDPVANLEGSARTSPAAIAGVLILLCALGLRLYSNTDLAPGFGADPMVLEAPILGLTPTPALACDAAMIFGAGLILLAQAARGLGARWWEIALFVAGAAGACAQLFVRVNWFEDAMLGSSWVAAMGTGLAASAASRDRTLRVWLLAGALGLLPLLALRGAIQVYVEQPETYKQFLKDKAQILDAHGWTTDSPMAKAYERRVSQAEAVGWFGLSNVLSTLMACGAIAFGGLALTRRAISPSLIRDDPFRRTWFAASLTCCGLCIAGAAWAGSKGGFAVLAVGLLLVMVAFSFATRPGGTPAVWRRLAPALGVAAIVAPLVAVTLRGLVGARLHELSLWFRAFYQVGAARVFAAHPWLGVGPTEFKDAYMLVKPAIAPEDVSSPHCLLLDHTATLGIFGVAWVVLWGVWSVRAGRSLSISETQDEPGAWSAMRPHLRLLGAALAMPVLASNFLEARVATPEMTAVRIGALLLGVVVAGAAIRYSQVRPALVRLACAAAALAAIAHCQIELTGVTPGAAAWVMLLLGASGTPREQTAPASRRPVAFAFAFAALTLLAGLALPMGALPRVWQYEAALRDAYDLISPARELSARAMGGKPTATTGDSPARLQADLLAAHAELSAALQAAGLVPPTKPASLPVALTQVRLLSAALAWRQLGHAWVPNQNGPLAASQAMSRLMVMEAELREELARLGSPMPKTLEEGRFLRAAALELAAQTTRAQPSAETYGWMGTLCQALADEANHYPVEAKPEGLEKRRFDAFRLAVLYAPHSPLYPAQAALAAQALGNPDEAKSFAQQALDADRNMQLDPLAGLPESLKAKMNALAEGRPREAVPNSNQSPIKSPLGPPGGP